MTVKYFQILKRDYLGMKFEPPIYAMLTFTHKYESESYKGFVRCTKIYAFGKK